jgi:hypothetical protein
MINVLEKLKGGDFRSIGKANELVKSVIENPKLLPLLFKGMNSADPLIRMRAADAAEKVSKEHPQYLQPFKSQLINKLTKIPQQEVRWHAAQMFSYLTLTPRERTKVARILFYWLKNEKSNIVRVMSLQTLADFAKQDIKIKNKTIPLLKNFLVGGTPSLKSRSRKLLREFSHIR